MKYLNETGVLIALLAMANSPLLAQEASNELTVLKTQRDQAVKKATAEIDKVYIVKLKNLQKKALAKQDLDGAIAIKEELASLKVITSDEARNAIEGHEYSSNEGANKKFKFCSNGVIEGIESTVRWKYDADANQLIMTGWNGNTETLVFDMSSDMKTAKINLKKSTKSDAKTYHMHRILTKVN